MSPAALFTDVKAPAPPDASDHLNLRLERRALELIIDEANRDITLATSLTKGGKALQGKQIKADAIDRKWDAQARILEIDETLDTIDGVVRAIPA